MLYVQAKNGYRSLTGIDYSSYAIELAKSVASDEQLDIEYKVRRLILTCDLQISINWKQLHTFV